MALGSFRHVAAALVLTVLASAGLYWLAPTQTARAEQTPQGAH